MPKQKIINIALITIITGLILYAFLLRKDTYKEIKKLTHQIENKVDSLHYIQKKYDSLLTENDRVISELAKTRINLLHLKNSVDSISEQRIRNIANLNKALKNLITKQKEFEKLKTNDSTFRFK